MSGQRSLVDAPCFSDFHFPLVLSPIFFRLIFFILNPSSFILNFCPFCPYLLIYLYIIDKRIMKIGMHYIDNFDWTVIFSVLALSISFASKSVDFLSVEMSIISLASASILCITAFIKLIDFLLEKGPLWMDKLMILKQKIRNLRKPKG